MGNNQRAYGSQRLASGIKLARAGLQQYKGGDTTGAVDQVDQGRGMMGEGVTMMGLGCCLADGAVVDVDAGTMASCAAMMGQAGAMTLQGLGKFDGARPMMTSSDPAVAGQAMMDMGAGMDMMEQGSMQMMGAAGGSMGSMM